MHLSPKLISNLYSSGFLATICFLLALRTTIFRILFPFGVIVPALASCAMGWSGAISCDVGPCLLGVLHNSASRVVELRLVDLPTFLWGPMEKSGDLVQEIKSWCLHRLLIPEVFTGHFIGIW